MSLSRRRGERGEETEEEILWARDPLTGWYASLPCRLRQIPSPSLRLSVLARDHIFARDHASREKTQPSQAVPRRGLEPPTYGLGNRCSIRLSYQGPCRRTVPGRHIIIDHTGRPKSERARPASRQFRRGSCACLCPVAAPTMLHPRGPVAARSPRPAFAGVSSSLARSFHARPLSADPCSSRSRRAGRHRQYRPKHP